MSAQLTRVGRWGRVGRCSSPPAAETLVAVPPCATWAQVYAEDAAVVTVGWAEGPDPSSAVRSWVGASGRTVASQPLVIPAGAAFIVVSATTPFFIGWA